MRIFINIHIPLYLVLKIDFYSVSNACEFFSVKTTHLKSSGERAQTAVVGLYWSESAGELW